MVTIEALEKALNKNEIQSIYVLYGEELYLLETNFKKIKKAFGEIVKGINYIEIDDSNLDQLIQDIQTPAFGYNKKLIVVKNTGIFKREVKKKGIAFVNTRDKICEYFATNAKDIKQDNIIVFIEEDVDKTKMLSTIEEIGGIVCNFEYQKPNQIASRINSICKAYNVEITPDTINYFIECVGVNMQNVINEIRKQIEYVGENGKITKETIDLLVIKQIEGIIFDLTDNLGKKNIKSALQVLNNLLYAKEPIQKILITLYNHFKKLYMVKLSVKYNEDVVQSLNLKPNQMFLVNKYKAQSNFFKEQELKAILQELINLDKNYKIGLIDINIGLESILCKYCS